MSLVNQSTDFTRRFSFSCDEPNSEIELEVVRFEGEESLAGLYRFEILLVSACNDIDEQKLLGRQAVFRLNDGVPGGEDIRYCGLITVFEQQHQVTGWTFYKAVLEPKLWRLGKFHLTEVYLNKTPREILEIVLEAGGLNHTDYTLAYLQPEGYPQQKFICQYRESYLHFITRWCEHLGVYWWYEQQQSGEQIVFGNSYRNHDPQVINLSYQPAGELDAMVTGARRVQCFSVSSQPLPRQVTVSNYYYQKASLQIKGSAIVSEHGIGEVNYYGMHAESNEIAQNIARIRAEGLICRGRQFNGESTATGLRCGHFLELSGHYRADFNRQYLLTRVSHRGSQAGLLTAGLGVQTAESNETFYRAEFSAIPSDVQYRPELLQPWPRIEGTLNAFIDAEGSGKYAELNEDGEYKVQLPYYLTEKDAAKASAWIRMASPYAGTDDSGSAHGMHFPLHKGTEVLLSFHNGNPDKPVILGAVTNSQTPNVVTNENQQHSVIQTAGHNSMEFHDEEGRQGIHLFSPTSDTYFSMGARPPAAKGVGADATGGIPSQTPTFVSAATDASGSTVVMTYTSANPLLATPAPEPGDFTVKDNGTQLTVSRVSVDATNKTVTLTLAGPVQDADDSVTVAYSPSGDNNPIQDSSGNKAASLPATNVTNNLPATGADVANAIANNNAANAAPKPWTSGNADPVPGYTIAGGIYFATSGNMNFTAQNTLSNVWGTNTSFLWGLNTAVTTGVNTAVNLGGQLQFNAGPIFSATAASTWSFTRGPTYNVWASKTDLAAKMTNEAAGNISFNAGVDISNNSGGVIGNIAGVSIKNETMNFSVNAADVTVTGTTFYISTSTTTFANSVVFRGAPLAIEVHGNSSFVGKTNITGNLNGKCGIVKIEGSLIKRGGYMSAKGLTKLSPE